MMRRLTAFLCILGFAFAVFTVAAQPAHASISKYRWHYPSVCVEFIAWESKWPGSSAVDRWDNVPKLDFAFRGQAGGCDAWSQEITVRQYSKADGRYAYMKRYHWTGTVWISRCLIYLNNYYRPKYWADRRSIIMHELGHCSGLNHTSKYRSLMNIYTVFKWNYPQDFDKSEVRRRHSHL